MELNDRVLVAKLFAAMMHADKGQTYGNDPKTGYKTTRPYSVHLEAVERVLLRFGEVGKDMLAAAHLHDVVEDAGVAPEVIIQIFGASIANLVLAVTDSPGVNRKERKALTYNKIRQQPGATKLKLADRIANVENCLATGEIRLFTMYQKEQSEFSKQLRTIGELDDMWNHLEYILRKS